MDLRGCFPDPGVLPLYEKIKSSFRGSCIIVRERTILEDAAAENVRGLKTTLGGTKKWQETAMIWTTTRRAASLRPTIRQRIRAETARTVLKTAARIAQETVPGTLWIMAETARDKKMWM